MKHTFSQDPMQNATSTICKKVINLSKRANSHFDTHLKILCSCKSTNLQLIYLQKNYEPCSTQTHLL